MKKISLFVFAGLAAIACTKSPVDLEIHTSPIQEEPEVVKKGRTANIVMYADVDREVETRVSATEESGIINFEFDEGDEISAFFKSDECVDKNVKFTYNGSKFVTDEGQSYTTLDGDEMPEVYAIYPYDKGLGSVTDLGKVPVTIPQVQMYGSYTSNPYFPKQFARFMAVPSALKKKDGSYSIETKFYPMGSMVKLQVQNATETPLNIKSVNIYGPDNLSGDFTVDVTKNPAYNSEAEFTLTPDDGGVQYNHVCVSYGSEGKVLNNKGRLTIYAFVNAADFDPSTKGFSMTVSTDKGTYIADFEKRKDGVDGFARNRRDTYTITLDDNNRKVSEAVARYTDNAGAWQTASSLSDAIKNVSSGGIVELLKDANHSGNFIALNDKNFTLNGNGYAYNVANRDNIVFSHSSASSTATDITFRNIKFKSNETAETANSKRFISSAKPNSIITLAEGTEIEGIYCKGVSGIVYNSGTININGAKVKDCGVIKDGSNGGNGGFIYSTGEAAVVNFNSGEISNCSAEDYGGALYGSSSSTINFNGGEISNCSASSGSAIFATGSGSILNVVGGKISISNGTTAAIYGNHYATQITIGREDDPSSCPIINNTTGRGIYSYGTTNIYGGNFTTSRESVYSLSGSNGNAYLNIYGGSFESISTGAIFANKYKNDNDYTVYADIAGGRFKCKDASDVVGSSSTGFESIQIKGGYFSQEVKSEYLKKADETAGTREYKNYPNDEYEGYPYKVEEQHAAIFVSGSKREQKATIEDAIDAANASGVGACEIILTENCTIGSTSKDVINSEGVTLDLNGMTLTQNGSNRLGVSGSGHLIITDETDGNTGVVKQSENDSKAYTLSIQSGTLDIKGGIIRQDVKTNGTTVCINGNATLNVTDRAVISGDKGTALYLLSGDVNIGGGEINSTSHALYANSTLGPLHIKITGGKIISSGSQTYAIYAYSMVSGSSVAINGGYFRSNYYAVRSCKDNNVEIRVEKDSNLSNDVIPYFYTYNEGTYQYMFYRESQSPDNKTNKTVVSYGYFGGKGDSMKINATESDGAKIDTVSIEDEDHLHYTQYRHKE